MNGVADVEGGSLGFTDLAVPRRHEFLLDARKLFHTCPGAFSRLVSELESYDSMSFFRGSKSESKPIVLAAMV